MYSILAGPTFATSALVYVLPDLFATGSGFAISANPVEPLIVTAVMW